MSLDSDIAKVVCQWNRLRERAKAEPEVAERLAQAELYLEVAQRVVVRKIWGEKTEEPR